jgi:hypothetical protein
MGALEMCMQEQQEPPTVSQPTSSTHATCEAGRWAVRGSTYLSNVVELLVAEVHIRHRTHVLLFELARSSQLIPLGLETLQGVTHAHLEQEIAQEIVHHLHPPHESIVRKNAAVKNRRSLSPSPHPQPPTASPCVLPPPPCTRLLPRKAQPRHCFTVC